MTAAFAERHRWFDPLVSWTAHAAPAMWAVMVALYIASDIGLRDSWLRILIAAVGISVCVVSGYTEVRHQHQLCARCADKIPLNGSQSAELVQWMLWASHNSFKVIMFTLGAQLGVSITVWIGWLPQIASNVALYGYLLMFAVTSQAHLIHRVHRPWCPWCRGWSEGDEPDVVPEPTPPSKTVQPS